MSLINFSHFSKLLINAQKNASIILISIISLFIIFNGINIDEIESWDEGTNAQVVRELNNSFPYLQFNEADFFEKPPLWYYLTFVVTKIFGFNLFSLRLISAISAVIILYLIYKISTKQNKNLHPILPILVTLSSGQLFFENSDIFSTHTFRSADLDALFLLFVMLSYYFLDLNPCKKYLQIAAGIFAGLAFMTKGPIGLIVIIGFLSYKLFFDRREIIQSLFLVLLPILVIILPWHIFMYLKFENTFINEYLLYSIFTRTKEPLEGHLQNSLFYFAVLFNPLFYPYFIINILYFYRVIKQKLYSSFSIFTQIFVSITTILLFSFVQTKLSWYILPAILFLIISSSIQLRELLNNSTKISKLLLYSYIFLFVLLSFIRSFSIEEPQLNNVLNKYQSAEYLYIDQINRSDLYYLNQRSINKIELDEETIEKAEMRIFLIERENIVVLFSKLPDTKFVEINGRYAVVRIGN